jgi:hypothetical protein
MRHRLQGTWLRIEQSEKRPPASRKRVELTVDRLFICSHGLGTEAPAGEPYESLINEE